MRTRIAILISTRQSIARRTGYMESARRAVSKVAGGGSSAYAEAASPYGGETSPFGDRETWNAQNLYRAASRDHAFTAIRPIAVKVADQLEHVGLQAEDGASARAQRLITKGYNGNAALMVRDRRDTMRLKNAPRYVKSIGESIDVLESHPLLSAFQEPNEFMTCWALKYTVAFSLCATGQAIIYFDVDEANDRVNLWYFPRTWITPIHTRDRAFHHWVLRPPGTTGEGQPIPRTHIANVYFPHPADPTMPHSPLQSQARAVNTDDEIQTGHLASMKNITKPGMLVFAGDMGKDPNGNDMGTIEFTPAQRKQIRDAVRLRYQGAMRMGDPLILDRLIKDVKPYMPSPVDLDFPNGSRLTKERIMHGIGTNPFVAGQSEGTNRATAAVANEIHYELTVNPILTLFGETVTQTARRFYQSDGKGKLVFWLERAVANDADLRLEQLDLLASYSLLKGNEMREAFDMSSEPEFEGVVKPKSNPVEQPHEDTEGDGKTDAGNVTVDADGEANKPEVKGRNQRGKSRRRRR